MLYFISQIWIALALTAQSAPISPLCLPKKSGKTRVVTHYMVPVLKNFDHKICNQMEGTCIFTKNGQQYLHNYGYGDQLLRDARCKNGYGNMNNCLHPCRTVAASMKHHRFGQVLFIKSLVGKKCGTQRDRTYMIHDGFVVVGDTGSPRYFNQTGRLDFFWGRCHSFKNGICQEGAVALSSSATSADYCIAWDPRDPLKNKVFKVDFVNRVRQEAIRRGDEGAASDFDLDKTIGPKFGAEALMSLPRDVSHLDFQ